jgi:hypothetical protein
MTVPQGLAFAIVIVMMALFVWGRWRYDVVAALALLAGVAVGDRASCETANVVRRALAGLTQIKPPIP